ncbi:MAG: hypothetical protein LBP79_06735, partial [Clostridiales bacterium]|nr:hypothetical protein [Clostridiales bacterium]
MAEIILNNVELKNLNNQGDNKTVSAGKRNNQNYSAELTIDSQSIKNILGTDAKIINATVELDVVDKTLTAASAFIVKDENSLLLDYIKAPGDNSKICVNITEELNEIIKSGVQNVKFIIAAN